MFAADRKTSYKLPPTTIRDKLVSQEARRTKALEEQKRRRAQKVDSSRQLDFFADLSLAEHSDEEVHEDQDAIEDNGVSANPGLAAASVAAYASMLRTGDTNDTPEMLPPSPDTSTLAPPSTSEEPHEEPVATLAPSEPKKSRKRSGKNSHKRRAEANKASNSNRYKAGSSQWADKCMYAELLEMNGDEAWEVNEHSDDNDGLPSDLEYNWVAVAPVPKGKRCLVVTHQSAGVAGVVPNTTLRSRLLGKSLLSRFPSPLPPLTVLDCILDNNWRENGVLHVLDVVRWKGQDVADCEARFRFWWRDTRLAELSQSPPPTSHFVTPSSSTVTSNSLSRPPNSSQNPYHFPYPTTFIPVPYHSTTTLAALDTQIIPAARSVREIPIILPASAHPFTFTTPAGASTAAETGRMDVETPQHALGTAPPNITPATATAMVQPDGLLLYVAEASYEPGTSPLSSWVPICGYDEHAHERESAGVPVAQQNNPLYLFHRLVKKRLARALRTTGSGAVVGACDAGTKEMEMEL